MQLLLPEVSLAWSHSVSNLSRLGPLEGDGGGMRGVARKAKTVMDLGDRAEGVPNSVPSKVVFPKSDRV